MNFFSCYCYRLFLTTIQNNVDHLSEYILIMRTDIRTIVNNKRFVYSINTNKIKCILFSSIDNG